MIRDPFYREIQERLAGRLDPEAFERCAADLLREAYPTLVPIRGGDDAGMDGAVADGDGLPFPLVTTTAQDVIGNLRRSLNSYLENEGTQRRCVVATSQVLTRRRRENLQNAARELGFTLLQIHDGEWFAGSLRHNPFWCQELLGLTGSPPALSVMPLSTRPFMDAELIGRSEDLEWLAETPGDLLLVGQPGLGKTFLLHRFAKQQGALFAHTEDVTEIAAELRSQEPTALIVDDAHVRADFLPQLRRLRDEMGAEFRVIAASWPGSREAVARALDVTSSSVRSLELLSKDQIAELVQNVRIRGPRGLVQEIVNQAEGRPGLAVTLSSLCLRGDVPALASGDALAGEIAAVYRPLVGDDAEALLASFALGGDPGVSTELVATYLDIPLHMLYERVSKLAAGGVLLDMGQGSLAVRPPALRQVLVRNVFFGGPSLPVEPLIEALPARNEATLTLVGAMHRGAQVPPGFIRGLVEESTDAEVWTAYAYLGRAEAEWIASEHPEWIPRIARAALSSAPEAAIPILLAEAVGDDRPLHSHPNHTMRQIADWVTDARPGTGAVLERRRQMLASARRWLREGGDARTGVHALALSLSPQFDRTEPAPGVGYTIHFLRGFVTLEEARQIRALWPAVLEQLTGTGPEIWRPVQDVVRAWAFPGMASQQPLPDDLREEAASFAGDMLTALVDAAASHPGLIQWARSMAERLGVEIRVPADVDFETLFPPQEVGNWRERQEDQREQAQALAERWAQGDPKEVVSTLVRYEREASLTDHRWPRWTPFVCEVIAEGAADGAVWADELVRAEASPDLVVAFFVRLLREQPESGRQLAERCLESYRYRLAAAVTVLTVDDAPADLIDRALDNLDGAARWIESACMRQELPASVVRRLLTHEDPSLAGAAAIGQWQATQGTIPEELQEDWQQAVLRCPSDEWTLKEILGSDPELCLTWLSERLEDPHGLWHYDDAAVAALGGLDADDHRRLLELLPDDLFAPGFVEQLIGDDLELFQELLAIERLERLHLLPLAGHPNLSGWALKAQAVLDAGYSAPDVARAALGSEWSWTGDESAMWRGWQSSFEELQEYDDERLRQVGVTGAEIAAARAEHALERERRERIRGL